MAGYSWVFSAPASPITITDGTNTYTYTGTAIPLGGYSYTVTDFEEDDSVTVSAIGYNTITTTVGTATLTMTAMPEVSVQNVNSTNYLIKDAKARQQVADLETNVYNDLQNYVTTNTKQTISRLKNFSNDGQSSDNAQIEITTGNIDASNAPASTKYAGLLIKDTNGTRIGKLEVAQYSDGSLRTVLDATNLDGSHGQIAVQIAPDGTVSTVAPTPASGDSTTKIATTAWVKTDAQPAASYASSASMTWGSVYTCPANGYVRVRAKARDNGMAYLRLNSTSGSILWQHGDYGGASIGCSTIPVAKGTKVVAHGGASDQGATFYYGK